MEDVGMEWFLKQLLEMGEEELRSAMRTWLEGQQQENPFWHTLTLLKLDNALLLATVKSIFDHLVNKKGVSVDSLYAFSFRILLSLPLGDNIGLDFRWALGEIQSYIDTLRERTTPT